MGPEVGSNVRTKDGLRAGPRTRFSGMRSAGLAVVHAPEAPIVKVSTVLIARKEDKGEVKEESSRQRDRNDEAMVVVMIEARLRHAKF